MRSADIRRLEPCPLSCAHIAAPGALRDVAFEVHLAGMPEDRRAVVGHRMLNIWHPLADTGPLPLAAPWMTDDAPKNTEYLRFDGTVQSAILRHQRNARL